MALLPNPTGAGGVNDLGTTVAQQKSNLQNLVQWIRDAFGGGNDTSTAAGRGAARAAFGIPDATGELVVFLGASAAPTGFIKANGALLSRASFPGLFAYANAQGLVTEAAWSSGSQGRYSVGDGSTTFRVPDLRGEFLRMWDDGAGNDSGRAIGTRQTGQMENHNHPIVTVGVPGSGSSTGMVLSGTGAPQGALTTYITAAGTGSETRPRNVSVLACIRI